MHTPDPCTPLSLLLLLPLPLTPPCRQVSGAFQNPASPKSHSVLVDKLAVVAYECRWAELMTACPACWMCTHGLTGSAFGC